MTQLLEAMLDGLYFNPLNERERVLIRKDGEPLAGVTLHHKDEGAWGKNYLHLEEIRALTPGGGRVLMQLLVDRADKLSATIAGYVKPLPAVAYGMKKMQQKKLMDWYKQFGFKQEGGANIIRRPIQKNPMTAEELRRGARTAIARFKPSVPMLELQRRGLLIGRKLDYGAGRGFDADHFEMEKFDPTYWPRRPVGTFDTITCNYVLNVVPPEAEAEILGDILNLLDEGGTAYITVRRDVKKDGMTATGTYQRRAFPSLPLLMEKKGAYATYVLEA